jgi:hypothetical protein
MLIIVNSYSFARCGQAARKIIGKASFVFKYRAEPILVIRATGPNVGAVSRNMAEPLVSPTPVGRAD